MSLHAIKRLRLDGIWWLVSPQNLLKPSKGMAPFEERLRRARALTRPHPRLWATDLEARLGTRYSADTLRELRQRFPGARFVWLMGADNLRDFHRWRRWDNIFAAVPIAVFRRPGYGAGRCRGKAAIRFDAAWRDLRAAASLATTTPPAWLMLDNALNRLSATQLRQNKTVQTPHRKGT